MKHVIKKLSASNFEGKQKFGYLDRGRLKDIDRGRSAFGKNVLSFVLCFTEFSSIVSSNFVYAINDCLTSNEETNEQNTEQVSNINSPIQENLNEQTDQDHIEDYENDFNGVVQTIQQDIEDLNWEVVETQLESMQKNDFLDFIDKNTLNFNRVDIQSVYRESVIKGWIHLCELLINEGADIDEYINGCTHLQADLSIVDSDTAKVLLKYGANSF